MNKYGSIVADSVTLLSSGRDTIMAPTASIDNSLRVFRSRAGWSQAELGRSAGLSRAEISAIETGRLVPSTAAALALASALGCTVEALFHLPRRALGALLTSGPLSHQTIAADSGERRSAAAPDFIQSRFRRSGCCPTMELSVTEFSTSIPAMIRAARSCSPPATPRSPCFTPS